MKKTLTILLVLACGLSLDSARGQTSEGPLEEVVVSGEFAGPGMWQVTHPNYPGHTLWIVGEPPPLPIRLSWRSQKVERVALQSQEILLQAGFSVKPDEEIGAFRMLTLVPAAMKARKNPDKARLQELIPPDIYGRWLVQKKLYLGRNSGVEKMRPIFAAYKLHDAAVKKLQLSAGGTVWSAIAKIVGNNKIRVTSPAFEFTFEADELRGKFKAFLHQRLSDAECFAQTVELTEALSNKQVEEVRARAWAMADLATLQELPPLPDPELSCSMAIVNSEAMSASVPTDLGELLVDLWLDSARRALTKNESTLAVVQLSQLLGDDGYLERLRKRGYQILAPN